VTSTTWIDEFPARIAELDGAHLRRKRRVVTPEDGARLLVDGQSMLAFCSNDYLGLAQHPELIDAACAGARAFGVGSGASPMVSGHSAANAALEQELAAFVQLPRALYFYAGYATNISRWRPAVAREDPSRRACRPGRAGRGAGAKPGAAQAGHHGCGVQHGW
jgi:8-amino-7-oxononanoate synthase